MLPENEPDRSRFARELARTLAAVAVRRQTRRTGLLIGEINEAPARDHFLARFLEESGFVQSPLGLQMRHIAERPRRGAEAPDMPEGDTIFRTARTLQRAIAGQTVTRFESVLPKLTRIDYDTPLAGRTVEKVEAQGKWLLIAVLRRPDAAHPHADERQLAHLPSRRTVAAPPLLTCAS